MSYYKLKMSLCFWRRANREDAAGYAPISLRLTLAGRAEIATEVDVPEAYWHGTKLKVQLPTAKKDRRPELDADRVDELNRRLNKIYEEVDDIRQKYRKLGKPYTPQQVAAEYRNGAPEQKPVLTLVDLMAQFEKAMRRPALNKAPATLRSYASRLGNLREFLRTGLKRPDLPASEVTMQTGRKLEHWSQDNGHGDLSMRKQVNMLQMVLGYGAVEGLLPGNVLHGYKYESATVARMPVFLPAPEVEALEQAVFTDIYLREIADMWLFMCHTGLSYVDYIRYATQPDAYTHRDADGNDWIRMVRQKMQRRKPEGFSVPLLPKAKAVLERRRFQLPRLDNAYANRKLKEISQALDLSLPLCCKVARATFSQHMRDLGVSGETVAAMIGDTETVLNRFYSRIREERITKELGYMFVSKRPDQGTGTSG